MLLFLLLLFGLYKTTDSMPKPVAIADTEEIGKFIEIPMLQELSFL